MRRIAFAALVLMLSAAVPAVAKEKPQQCNDPAGCISVWAREPVRIATLLESIVDPGLTALGVDNRRGVELAVDSRGGTVLDHPIELVYQLDGCDGAAASAAVPEILKIKALVGVVGTSCSTAARPVIPDFGAAGVLLISPSNTAADLTDPTTHEPFYLRTVYNDRYQGVRMAEYVLSQLSLDSAATIDDGSDAASRVVEGFVDAFEEGGGTIVAQEQSEPGDPDCKPGDPGCNPGDPDFTDELDAIVSAGADFVFFALFSENRQGQFVGEARTALGDTPLGTNEFAASQAFLDEAGAPAEGVYAAVPDYGLGGFGAPPWVFPNPDYADFVTAYEAAYGESPPFPFHAHAFDATNLLLDAVEEVAVVKNGKLTIGRTALREALYAVEGYPGLVGTLTCDNNGDCNPGAMDIYVVEEGTFVQVYPAP